MARLWRDFGLSMVLAALFLGSMVGQTLTGWRVYNDEQREHAGPTVGLLGYFQTGHFGEATFENWESEFLQMAFYIVLTARLFQRGSSESKAPGVKADVDRDPRQSRDKAAAPWPVRRGGWILGLYEHSLSLTFGLLFVAAFTLHGIRGAVEHNAQQLAHGQPPQTVVAYMTGSQFWFESFQNWQSEFLSLVAMVMLSIVLRERGSPESKPVDAPMWETRADGPLPGAAAPHASRRAASPCKVVAGPAFCLVKRAEPAGEPGWGPSGKCHGLTLLRSWPGMSDPWARHVTRRWIAV